MVGGPWGKVRAIWPVEQLPAFIIIVAASFQVMVVRHACPLRLLVGWVLYLIIESIRTNYLFNVSRRRRLPIKKRSSALVLNHTGMSVLRLHRAMAIVTSRTLAGTPRYCIFQRAPWNTSGHLSHNGNLFIFGKTQACSIIVIFTDIPFATQPTDIHCGHIGPGFM